MKHPVWIRWIMAWMAALVLAACGGGGGESPSGPSAASSRIYMLAAPAGQLLPGDSPTH